MHQTRATAVNGRKVQADGKWFTVMGNHPVAVGDFIWTDGKCVYGHHAMHGGESFIPAAHLAGVPLIVSRYADGAYIFNYMRYGKTGLQDFGCGNAHRYMVNRGNRYDFLPEGDGTMDGDIDSQGNLYTLEQQQICCDWETGAYYPGENSGACVRRNGEIIKTYDILPLLLPYVEETKARAEALAQPIPSDPDVTDRVPYTELDTFYNLTWSGKVDEKGNFQVLVNARIRSSHREHAVHWDGYGFGNVGRCECNTWFTYDGETAAYWYKGYTTSWYPYHEAAGTLTGEGWSRRDEVFSPAGSFKLMLHDGYYVTVKGLENFVKEWAFTDNCTLSYYSPQGEFLFSAKGNPGRALMICPVGTGKYLYGYPGRLLLWENGHRSEIVSGCSNYRIRKMPNLKKWKRQAGGI